MVHYLALRGARLRCLLRASHFLRLAQGAQLRINLGIYAQRTPSRLKDSVYRATRQR